MLMFFKRRSSCLGPRARSVASSPATVANMSVQVADYTNPEHARLVGALLDDYAADPLGDGVRLPSEIPEKLASCLAAVPGAFSVLAWVGDQPAGVCNCFAGFSTFKCKPLVNIHDCFVRSEFRGAGICGQMLAEIERVAVERGCCKITLEVLSENKRAQKAYRRAAFAPYELDPKAGHALFWQKNLSQN